MLNNIHLVDAHGDNFPGAVIDVNYTKVTKLKISSEVEESIKTPDGEWVEEVSPVDVDRNEVDEIYFRAEYWSNTANHAAGKLSRPLLNKSGENLFKVEFTDADVEMWENGFDNGATQNQKKVWFCEKALKESILPSLRG